VPIRPEDRSAAQSMRGMLEAGGAARTTWPVVELLSHFGVQRLTQPVRHRIADALAEVGLSAEPPLTVVQRHDEVEIAFTGSSSRDYRSTFEFIRPVLPTRFFTPPYNEEEQDWPTDPSLLHDDVGRVSGATGIDDRRRHVAMLVDHRSDGSEARCSIDISNDDEGTVLQATGIVDPTAETVRFEFADTNVSVRWTIDFSAYDETHVGFIHGRVNTYPMQGIYDPVREAASVNLALEPWVSQASISHLEYFRPVLTRIGASGGSGREEYSELIERTIRESRWTLIGRAAMLGTRIHGGGSHLREHQRHRVCEL
jgi:hypothetical protein